MEMIISILFLKRSFLKPQQIYKIVIMAIFIYLILVLFIYPWIIFLFSIFISSSSLLCNVQETKLDLYFKLFFMVGILESRVGYWLYTFAKCIWRCGLKFSNKLLYDMGNFHWGPFKKYVCPVYPIYWTNITINSFSKGCLFIIRWPRNLNFVLKI